METIDLKLLSKDTTKKFKNCLKLVVKEKDGLYPQLGGVHFAYDKDLNKKYLIGSNGKVAIIYMDVDYPNEFMDKVINNKGEIINVSYPNIRIPSAFNEVVSVTKEQLTNLYDNATKDVKDEKLTQAKCAKEKKTIGVPIADNFDVDYFYFKDFMKMVEMVGTFKLLYNKTIGSIALTTKEDKSVFGLVINDYRIN